MQFFLAYIEESSKQMLHIIQRGISNIKTEYANGNTKSSTTQCQKVLNMKLC